MRKYNEYLNQGWIAYQNNPVSLLEAVNLVAEMRLNYIDADSVRKNWPTDGRLNYIDSDILELAIKLVFGHKYDFYSNGGLYE